MIGDAMSAAAQAAFAVQGGAHTITRHAARARERSATGGAAGRQPTSICSSWKASSLVIFMTARLTCRCYTKLVRAAVSCGVIQLLLCCRW